jgi:fructosamine-3-kinase
MDQVHHERSDRGLIESLRKVTEWIRKSGIENATVSVLKRRYWGGVFLVRSPRKPNFVCKTGYAAYDPKCEAMMLNTLAEAGLPVPIPVRVEDDLLIMPAYESWPIEPECMRRVGQAVAQLHDSKGSSRYGYPQSTFFGSLPMNNTWSDKWSHFFIEHRLLAFADEAFRRNRLSGKTRLRVDKIAQEIEDILPEPDYPALLHGDIWSNNILSVEGFPVFLDPASFYGDPEYDLAFMMHYLDMRKETMIAYRSKRPLSDDFREIKQPVYDLAFDLAHLALFGERFLPDVENKIKALETKYSGNPE